MTASVPLKALDGVALKNMFGAGAVWLERNVAFVNSLNVFPVPDGDTGTNMLLTMQAAITEAQANPSHNAGEISAALSHGALLGARGNSGVILSQIMRGFARSIDKHETIDAYQLADALSEASRTAYKGVVKPVEGTILTVIREAADRAVIAAAQSDEITYVLDKTLESAHAAVVRTPQLLPVLKEAGVVDAGGQGLALLLEGACKHLNGETLEAASVAGTAQHLEQLSREEGWGYDIQFHIRGKNLPVDQIRETISAMGESALIVGDEALLKVHVHAPNPGEIIKYGAEQGALVNIIIENMQEQYVDFMAGNTADQRVGAENLGAPLRAGGPRAGSPGARSTDRATGIATIAIAPGEGLGRIFDSLGISAMVNGGPTMNPSAQDLLSAINEVNADQVVLLPNDKNIILAANQVRELTTKQVRVIPTRTIPQGIAALLAFNYQADLESNVAMMTAALGRIRTVEVTFSIRSTQFNGIGIRVGQPIALVDGEFVASGEDRDTLLIEVLRQVGAHESEIVTLYYGSQVPDAEAREVRTRVEQEFPEQAVELHAGGQPLYPFIVSIE